MTRRPFLFYTLGKRELPEKQELEAAAVWDAVGRLDVAGCLLLMEEIPVEL